MTKSKLMPKEFESKLSTLTEREQTYFRIMWPKYGVLYITAKPGVAKSAIARSIAHKMGFRYMDLRLSMIDETDVGLYPKVSETEGTECVDHIVPRWAIEANKQPTIVHFEELNRASQAVRNAALQILLEREIGVDFSFNEHVLMMSSGNLGDEDFTDVEEFDAALNNRLIHYKHTLDTNEWIDNFAQENVHPLIVSYMRANPEQLYKYNSDSQAYATPRSWTMLSEFIVSNFGEKASPREFLPLLKKVSPSYIGNSAVKFIRYCEDMLNININDVLDRYNSIKSELSKYNRDKKSELISQLKEIKINTLSDSQMDNVESFLNTVSEDELTGYLLGVIDETVDANEKRFKQFLNRFQTILNKIMKMNQPN